MSSSPSAAAPSTAVDIICSVYDGARYLPAFLRSLQAQTFQHWRLWIRDDGSIDESRATVNSFAASDERIIAVESTGDRLGVAGAFGWLLERLPADAAYVMFADQDDVWLPEKIERTLAVMLVAEQQSRGPVLVHSDLTVVDPELNEIDRSFWHFAGINPDSSSLRHLIVKNVVTGATAMLNRALRELVGRIPPEAVVHDWWVACVAAAFGRIEVLRAPTVLYRQHGANSIGARRPASALEWHELTRDAPGAFRRAANVRAGIAAAARQARAFLDRYRDSLTVADRQFLASYARIPERTYLHRKLDILRMHLLAENGFIQNVGILLRA